jgi:tRNA(Ile)-lysidine synthetase-like protein
MIVILGSVITIGNRFFKQNKFQYLLESPNNYNFDSNYLDLVKYDSSPLIKCLDEFCIKNSLKDKAIIISLSGGVDSMVTLAILMYLKKNYNFTIFTASIDYGLRNESNDESEFLIQYTKTFGIKSYVSYVRGFSRKKNDSGSRSEFEEESRNLRFNTYKKIIDENNLEKDTGVFVAHHQDDIVENIFTNSMKGANLLDLEVIKEINTIHNVKIFRPFIGFKKQVIYDFAHKYGIPYFLDTTPKWSKRGKMRNEIFPLLDSVFGQDWRNKMKQLGSQSNEWGNYIDKYIINPWLSEVKKGKAGIIIPLKDQPILIYSNVIMKSLHSISQSMLKKSSLEKINNLLITKHNKLVTLDGTLKKLNSFNLAEEQSSSGTRICALIESNTQLIIIDTSLVRIKDEFVENKKYQDIIDGIYYINMNVQTNISKFFNKTNISNA